MYTHLYVLDVYLTKSVYIHFYLYLTKAVCALTLVVLSDTEEINLALFMSLKDSPGCCYWLHKANHFRQLPYTKQQSPTLSPRSSPFSAFSLAFLTC